MIVVQTSSKVEQDWNTALMQVSFRYPFVAPLFGFFALYAGLNKRKTQLVPGIVNATCAHCAHLRAPHLPQV
jgi:hypothetical protein